MKLLFVVNPISGGKSKDQFITNAETFCKKYGLLWKYFHTTGQDDITKLKKEVEAYLPDRVVSIGGDGTTLMTSLALQGSSIPFGIIPMGSANGMAKELNVPADHMLALEDIVMSEITIPLDIIKVNDDFTMHLGDVGINAAMVEKFEKEEGRGWSAYAKHFLQAVNDAEKFSVSIETEEGTFQHEAYSLLIANTRMYGTGVIVNPEGDPHDGLFEIVVVTNTDWTGIINLGLTAIDKKVLKSLEGYATSYQVKKATIKFAQEKLLQLDGEVIGMIDVINARIMPGGVQFITTGDNNFIKESKIES